MLVTTKRPGTTNGARAAALAQLGRARPQDADAMFAAAAAALNHGLEDASLPLLRQAAQLHPGDARMWQMLGLAHRARDETGLAVHALRKAAGLAPRDGLIAHALARASLEAGLPATALFDVALALAPTDGSVMLGRAAAQFAAGRAEAAIAGLDAQLRVHPQWIAGHQAAARLLWMMGDQRSFIASFDEALRANPRDGVLWRERTDVLAKSGQVKEALHSIAQARSAVGQSRTLDQMEAYLVSESGDARRADTLFAPLLPFSDAAMVVRYVRHLFRAGRPDEAAALAGQHLGSSPEDGLWPYLALAWRLTGDPRWQWLEGDPRFVGVHDIGSDVGSLDDLAECLRRLHLARFQPLDQSLRGGTQTDGPLFSRIEPEIIRLRATVLKAVRAYVDQLPERDGRHPLLRHKRDTVRFAGSWSVRLSDGGHHANHVHSAGWISSAFYVALPPEGEPARREGWLTLGLADELGIRLDPIREVEPRPGRLVLFPSTMWHGTRTFAQGERLTVAFDIARPRE